MILAKITKVLFDSETSSNSFGNGFMIMEYECLSTLKDNEFAVDQNGNDLLGQRFIAKGYYLPTASTMDYELVGQWESDKRGRFFNTSYAGIVVESTEEGIISYLTSSLFSGIGMKTAYNIYNEFKENTLDIIENNPEELLKVSGIKEKRLQQIKESFEEHAASKETIIYLAKYNVPVKSALRVYDMYKADSVKIVEENPYSLLKVSGFDFKTVDQISLNRGFALDSHERITAVLDELLKQVEGLSGYSKIPNPGSTCIYKNELVLHAFQFLSRTVSEERITEILHDKVKDKTFAAVSVKAHGQPTHLIYRMSTNLSENKVAEFVVDHIGKVKTGFNLTEEINKIQIDTMIKLDKTQDKAIRNGLENKFSVITGGPGTGKTTIIKFLYEIYKANNPGKKILLCAPTGRASRKMSEATGAIATTVHQAFGLRPSSSEEEMFKTKEDHVIDAGLIIIDETSMLDVFVTAAILGMVPENAKLIFIGDVNQLPSVSAGSVLDDLISSDIVPVARLSSIHRQQEQSFIVRNASLINEGKTNLGFNKDFIFIEANSMYESKQVIRKEFEKYSAFMSVEEIAILSPFREKGVNILNPELQDVYNPLRRGDIEMSAKKFRLGDKVMQSSNRHDVGIANGDVGIISALHPEKESEVKITVDYGNGVDVSYEMSELVDLELAYAMTAHKSQGSEYDLVIINMMNEHSIMLQRKLLYTAVTRSKKRVILVGQKSAISKAIQIAGDTRLTMLDQKIKFLHSRKQLT